MDLISKDSLKQFMKKNKGKEWYRTNLPYFFVENEEGEIAFVNREYQTIKLHSTDNYFYPFDKMLYKSIDFDDEYLSKMNLKNEINSKWYKAKYLYLDKNNPLSKSSSALSINRYSDLLEKILCCIEMPNCYEFDIV